MTLFGLGLYLGCLLHMQTVAVYGWRGTLKAAVGDNHKERRSADLHAIMTVPQGTSTPYCEPEAGQTSSASTLKCVVLSVRKFKVPLSYAPKPQLVKHVHLGG